MTPQEAAAAEADARIVEGYHVLLSENLRLAHAAILEYANANNDGVKRTALGGLVGLLPYRIGRRTVWVDAARVPDLARRVGLETFPRDALVSFGIFCAAADTLARETATLH